MVVSWSTPSQAQIMFLLYLGKILFLWKQDMWGWGCQWALLHLTAVVKLTLPWPVLDVNCVWGFTLGSLSLITSSILVSSRTFTNTCTNEWACNWVTGLYQCIYQDLTHMWFRWLCKLLSVSMNKEKGGGWINSQLMLITNLTTITQMGIKCYNVLCLVSYKLWWNATTGSMVRHPLTCMWQPWSIKQWTWTRTSNYLPTIPGQLQSSSWRVSLEQCCIPCAYSILWLYIHINHRIVDLIKDTLYPGDGVSLHILLYTDG